jgi:hypothetical protein
VAIDRDWPVRLTAGPQHPGCYEGLRPCHRISSCQYWASLSLVSHTSRFVQCTIQCRFTIFTLVRHRLPTEVGTRTLSRLQVSGSPVQWNGDYWTGEPITWNESSQLPVVVERIHQDIPEGSCADFSHGGAAPTTLRVAPVRGWSGMKPQQSNYSNHPSRVSRTANGITIR